LLLPRAAASAYGTRPRAWLDRETLGSTCGQQQVSHAGRQLAPPTRPQLHLTAAHWNSATAAQQRGRPRSDMRLLDGSGTLPGWVSDIQLATSGSGVQGMATICSVSAWTAGSAIDERPLNNTFSARCTAVQKSTHLLAPLGAALARPPQQRGVGAGLRGHLNDAQQQLHRGAGARPAGSEARHVGRLHVRRVRRRSGGRLAGGR
jgi:hypothetical protein